MMGVASLGDAMRSDAKMPDEPFQHTRWQRFVRELFKIYGPAQTGLPPYPTPAEREAWRQANAPKAKAPAPVAPLPGYQVTEYRDGQGYVHRSLVPVAPSDPAPTPSPEAGTASGEVPPAH